MGKQGLHVSSYPQGTVGDLSSSQMLTAINLLRHVYGSRHSASPYYCVSSTLLLIGIYFSTQHIFSEPCGGDWLVIHQVISLFPQGTQLGHILVSLRLGFGQGSAGGCKGKLSFCETSNIVLHAHLLCCPVCQPEAQDPVGDSRATRWEEAYMTAGSHHIPSSHPQIKLSTQIVSEVIAKSSQCSHVEIVGFSVVVTVIVAVFLLQNLACLD